MISNAKVGCVNIRDRLKKLKGQHVGLPEQYNEKLCLSNCNLVYWKVSTALHPSCHNTQCSESQKSGRGGYFLCSKDINLQGSWLIFVNLVVT